MSSPSPLLVDVTLRDGGYLNDWEFEPAMAGRIVLDLDRAGIDLIEVGYADDAPDLALCAGCQPAWLETFHAGSQRPRLALMVRPSVADAPGVLRRRQGLAELIRIPTSIADPEPALRIAGLAVELGFDCSLNFTNVSAFSEGELERAITRAAAAGVVRIAYLADSRGMFRPEGTARLVSSVRSWWGGQVGFHAHDNLGLALANSRAAVEAGAALIDGSVNGYGAAGQNPDLGELVDTVREPVGADRRKVIRELSSDLDLPLPSAPWNCYVLAAHKNLMQDWVAILYERFGARTEAVLEAIPSRPYRTLDEVLARVRVSADC